MVTEGDLTSGQYIGDVLQNCTLETYVILLTNITSINSINFLNELKNNFQSFQHFSGYETAPTTRRQSTAGNLHHCPRASASAHHAEVTGQL